MTTPDMTIKIMVTTTDGVTTEHEYSHPADSSEWERLGTLITNVLSKKAQFIGLNNPMVGYNGAYIIRIHTEGHQETQRQVMGFLQDR